MYFTARSNVMCYVRTSLHTQIHRTASFLSSYSPHNEAHVWYDCSGWLRLRMPGRRQKKVSERRWYLPSTTRRQVTRNVLDNSGDGALTMVPLCRELSGTGDHTRKTMEVKRTSWANYGCYRRSYILLVSTPWLIPESSNMTQRVTRPVLLLVLLLWWVIRTHH